MCCKLAKAAHIVVQALHILCICPYQRNNKIKNHKSQIINWKNNFFAMQKVQWKNRPISLGCRHWLEMICAVFEGLTVVGFWCQTLTESRFACLINDGKGQLNKLRSSPFPDKPRCRVRCFQSDLSGPCYRLRLLHAGQWSGSKWKP